MADVPTDFRDGKAFPRRGRQQAAEALWLLRLFDKARADAAGTIYDYIYPCPMDKGVLERWGVSREEFDAAIAAHPLDDEIVRWFSGRVKKSEVDAANAWLQTKNENMDRQDAEEGIV
ncbi:MAG: DUF5069 domain-containing protein [Candidatus Tyrphobacter sp.]